MLTNFDAVALQFNVILLPVLIFLPNFAIEITTNCDMPMDVAQIAQEIKMRRKSLNIDQPTLSELAGVGINTLVNIERGTGNPQIKTLMAVLDTLGMQISITLKD